MFNRSRRWALVCSLWLLLSVAWSCGEEPSNANASIDDGDAQVTELGDTLRPVSKNLEQSAWAAAQGLTSAELMATIEILADDDMEGRDNLSAGGVKARAWIMSQLEALDLEPAGVDKWSQPFGLGVNLLARLPGADDSLNDEVLVLSAHYDHLGVVGAVYPDGRKSQCKKTKASPEDKICNGALDNASGVAVLLALAKALKNAPQPLRRSVVFVFFDAEEDGLVGSTYLANKQPLIPLKDIVAVLNVDMAGGAIFKDEPSTFAVDIEFSDGLQQKLEAVSTKLGYRIWPVSSFFVGKDGGGRSDHYPFRLKGVPELLLSCGAPPYYHTPIDEPELLDQDKLLKTARHVLLTAAALANDDGRPLALATTKPQIGDARAMIFLADQLLADPSKAGLENNKTALTLLTTWREKLQAWLDDPPQNEAQWKEYDELVRSIVAASFAAMKM